MKLIKYVFFFIVLGSYGQAITVDDLGVSKEELVAGLLDNSCVQITNVSQSDKKAVAYFNNNSGDFPISEGVIIRSGKAKLTEGPYSGQNLSTQINTNIDPDLQAINNASGQSTRISDVAFLQFEFIPLSEKFSFDFIFASNEYGQWQCASSDVFGFLLTEVATGETQNIAVIPETTKPISVRTINDSNFNDNCESDNPEYFESYQVGAANSVINMRGYTKVLTASAKIKAGKKYRIKLVIGDSNDSNYDSAILIAAGSFKTNLDLGADRQLCSGTFTRLNTGLEDSSYRHKWFFQDKEIPNETNHYLDVRKPGKYNVRVTKDDKQCDISDQIIVENLSYKELPDLVVCDNGDKEQLFNLTKNGHEELGLSSEQYDLVYFKDRAISTNQISETDLEAFKSEPGETIVVKLRSKETGEFCSAATSFKLAVNGSINLELPEEIVVCEPQGSNVVDVSEIGDIVYDQLGEGAYLFNIFRSAANAELDRNPVADLSNFSISGNTSTFQIFGKVRDTLVENCFSIFPLNVSLKELPPVSRLEKVVECSSYILPPIEFGDYYTQSGGAGRKLEAGDVIEDSGTYYIYNTSFSGCSNESSFKVELIEDYKLNDYYCGDFVVPTPPAGAFYDAPDGPNGTGKEISAGTVFTSDFSIYYYGELEDGTLCKQDRFNVEILLLPKVDKIDDVVVCNSFTLPELNNGTYYTDANGNGKRLRPGNRISSTKTIYIFNDNGVCSNESLFEITILPNFNDIVACGSYTLPAITVGNYFDESGKRLAPGTVFTESTSVLYSAETTDGSDCAKEIKFSISVNPIPEVSRLDDALVCVENGYILPEITKGKYFTKANRKGKQILPGTKIIKSQRIFINNLQNSCANESSFAIEVRKLAPVENFIDVYKCFGYELPKLQFGKYYTEPDAQGEELAAGTIIQQTQRIYIYNEWSDFESCTNEKFFTVYIEGVRVDRPEAINACDSYILPKLKEGAYFTESGGQGDEINPGTEITESTSLYIYKKAGVRFVCEDEYEFNIRISRTPIVSEMPDIEVCGSYKVPTKYSATSAGIASSDYEMYYATDPEDQDAMLKPGTIITQPGTYTIYFKAQSKFNETCFDYTSFNVTVYPLQDLEVEREAVCVNIATGEVETGAYFYTGLNPNVFEVDWFYNNKLVHTGVEFEAMQPGEYIIRTTKIDGKIETGCGFKETSVFVEESAKPEISVTVSEPFKDVAVVNVEVINGRGAYVFSMDDGEFQEENQFYDVSSGSHIINVKGKLGYCGLTSQLINVLKHPKFFTPNSDGYNDVWNIAELKTHPEAEVHIYDRYGAYITKIKPAVGGWDGSKEGGHMPSNDYWFQVNFKQDGRQITYKSHFALKR
ncbi:T9SS type B sorting domain-containing protein [Zunongwangia endophytica]|uniref:Choice-of-anchor L domain-containing protein n=1 Tax=Zunongwangia endophytica TaxID=1808945 RepID=A0ABV8HBW5_9FLAO|nr:choice-of-anchor L domain-containing protein [Zunongwangia endophytica]MDN3596321.1 choice-of-anchor L domain-containing protein [Zunongwangia endophytica]